jgi:hypothetical protein
MTDSSELYLVKTEYVSDYSHEKILELVGPLAIGFKGVVKLGQTIIPFMVTAAKSVVLREPTFSNAEQVFVASRGNYENFIEGLQGTTEALSDGRFTAIGILNDQFSVKVSLNTLDRKVGDVFENGTLNSRDN